MARFLLQGMNEYDDHLHALEWLLSLPNIERCLFSSAFINANGVRLIANHLQPLIDNIEVYLGIRNGITSRQAIEEFRLLNIFPICVDTATEAYIFHPKLYLSKTKQTQD